MSSDSWKQCVLGDLITFQRGHDLPRNNITEGEYPVVGSNGIIAYHNKFTTKAPCITIGRSGSIGNPLYINKDSWAHNTTLYIKEFFNTDPKFIYYLLKTLNFKHYAGGSAVPTLNRNHIHPISVFIPINKSEQKTIASILSILDDKIELNNRMNKVLEQMAQAIFKQWFVDFEFPNEHGEPYKSSGGEMEWCEELGKEIPKGWKISKLSELVESVSKTYKFIKDKIIFLNTSDVFDGEILHNNYSEVSSLPGQAKKSICKNDILYSEIRPANKRFAYVDFDSNDYVVSTKLMVLRSKGYVDPVLIYYYLTNQEVIDFLQMIAESRSGTFPQITFQSFDSLKLVIGPENIMCQLAKDLKSILKKVKVNKRQNKNLSNLRDTLLPKLMSGEIDVSQVEL